MSLNRQYNIYASSEYNPVNITSSLIIIPKYNFNFPRTPTLIYRSRKQFKLFQIRGKDHPYKGFLIIFTEKVINK